MPPSAPFATLPVSALPLRPRIPHRFLELPVLDVLVESSAFGRHRIAYRRLGEGPPLLLVHGLMTSGYSFRYVIEPLARHFTVYVPDLVGQGMSEKPDRPYRARALASSIADFQRAVGIRGCDVIGNSLGGYLSMLLALDDPGAIARLVNLHSPAVPMPRFYALRTAMSLPFAERVLATAVRQDLRTWIQRNVHYYDESLKSIEELDVYGAPLATPDGLHAFARILRETMDPSDFGDFEDRLESRRARREAFPIPLVLLYAERDPMVPPSVGTRLHALVPDAELVWLPRASHFAHVDAVERFLPPTLAFLGVE
ncbi:MAG: alpha/beta fold hydrolase [Polyangiales bacterium]